MNHITRRLAPLFAALGLSLALAAPVAAQPVIIVPGGLVNVTIIDFADVNLEDIVVQIPVSAAATICDVDVAILLAAIEDTGSAACEATSSSRANR
jgi:hypothetical protein